MEGFTQQAETVITQARGEARLLRHHRAGTEHLLLGLIGAPGEAADVLAFFGVDQDVARDRVRELVPAGDTTRSGHIGFTPRLKRVLDDAKQEAANLHVDRIDTQHLLLALINEGRGGAMRVLRQLGVDELDLRERLLQGSGGDTEPRGPGHGPAAPGGATPSGATPFKIAGRDREIDRLARILLRRHAPHALVLGAPGVGKTALVQGLFWEATRGRLADLPLGRRPVRWIRPSPNGTEWTAPGEPAECLFGEATMGHLADLPPGRRPVRWIRPSPADAEWTAPGNPAEVMVVDDAHLAPDVSSLMAWASGLSGPVVVILRSRAEIVPDAANRALTERFGVVELAEPGRDAAIVMVPRGLPGVAAPPPDRVQRGRDRAGRRHRRRTARQRGPAPRRRGGAGGGAGRGVVG